MSRTEITRHLKRLRDQIHSQLSADGEAVTRGEALAELLWKEALGWEEHRVSEDGNVSVILHPPQKWAMEAIVNRLEGRDPVQPPDTGKASLREQVSDMARRRLNELADAVVTAKKTPPPPPPPRNSKHA